MCDEAITASTSDEMMELGMKHLEVAHPEMAESVKKMPQDDPMMVAWSQKFKADWESKPNNA